MGTSSSPESTDQAGDETVAAVQDGAVVNASGYRDQLQRQYGLLGLAGIALTVDNAWIALGSSISVSIGASLLHVAAQYKSLLEELSH